LREFKRAKAQEGSHHMKDLKIAVAGRGTMGMPLLERLKEEGFDVPVSFTSRDLWFKGDSRGELPGEPLSALDERGIGNKLDRYMDGVSVMFIATPSGEHELPLIRYCIKRNIYVILFCKHALAYNYDVLRPMRHMIGANATVGGRTMSLPWLRMQNLKGKRFVIYAYWNASVNKFMTDVANGDSVSGAFQKAVRLGLAEPGATDYVSFLNAEIGGDMTKKVSIAMDDAILDGNQYMTPEHFDRYVPLSPSDVQKITLRSARRRYILRIDNMDLPAENDISEHGSLYAKFGEFTIYGGFYDLTGRSSLSGWVKDGETNGVQISFEGSHGHAGTVEMSGLGAGIATVDAAMNDLYQFVNARNGHLLEASWPERNAA
jgi:homoserine dehydrogenase